MDSLKFPKLPKVGLAVIATLFLVIMVLIYNRGYKAGFSRGAELGVNVSLDTVRQILIKQMQSDTTVTKMVLILPDTDVYVLSRKTLIPQDYVNQE